MNQETLREASKRARDLVFVVKKQHVQRADQAFNAVLRFSILEGGHRADDGVLVMLALMLIEHLAQTRRCEPNVLLMKLANCMELKRRLTNGIQA